MRLNAYRDLHPSEPFDCTKSKTKIIEFFHQRYCHQVYGRTDKALLPTLI